MEKLLDIPVTPAQTALSLERLGGPTLQTMLSSQSHSLLEMDPVFCSNACEVAHRDVKPANVCLARMQSLKLFDFGSAALLMSKPVHAWPWSKEYRAPEVDSCNAYDEPCDTYSLGKVCVIMLRTSSSRRVPAAKQSQGPWQPTVEARIPSPHQRRVKSQVTQMEGKVLKMLQMFRRSGRLITCRAL